MTLKISISGLRGLIGHSLTPTVVVNHTTAYGSYLGAGSKVVVGMDPRCSSEMLKNLVIGSFTATGCKVIDIGIATTPTLGIVIPELNADGGAMITASHNPIEWNGLKFFKANGEFIEQGVWTELQETIDNKTYAFAPAADLHEIEQYQRAAQHHIDKVLHQKYIDIDRIRAKRFKIVYDGVNGAGLAIIPELLEKLNCEVTIINGEYSGKFNHRPEPIAANLTQLSEAVKAVSADIGLATDPDSDRLALVTEKGRLITEEYTLAFAVKSILNKEIGCIVVNLSTSSIIEAIAREYSAHVYRTPIGELNVTKKLQELNGLIGGEGNGGVILPSSHYGRDAVVATALVLSELADRAVTVSEYIAQLPPFHMLKTKFSIDTEFNINLESDSLIDKFHTEFGDLQAIDRQDGIRIVLGDRKWFHLRESNTEPVVRLIVEAPDKAEALALKETIEQIYLKKRNE